jgi:uncharacterized membrane protein YgcG
LSAVLAFTLVTAAGCGTDAKGVDDCRDIEDARCAAAKNCGIVSDVGACQNFYRDQCLHGLAVNPPGSAAIKECVATIQAAGTCALQGTDTALGDCTNQPVSMLTTATTACQIVTNPEKTQECSFLQPNALDAGSADSGGSDGSSGDAGSRGSGGSGGSGGSTDSGTAGASGANDSSGGESN